MFDVNPCFLIADISGDAWDGAAAQYRVLVDGEQVGGELLAVPPVRHHGADLGLQEVVQVPRRIQVPEGLAESACGQRRQHPGVGRGQDGQPDELGHARRRGARWRAR